MNSLHVYDVEKSFGAVNVLRGLSLSFSAAQVTAIVGDNGAGKSTLLKLMAGLHKPDKGTIRLGDTLLSSTSTRQHRTQGIEMVYQDLALAKQQSTVANLFMGREITHRVFGLLNNQAMFRQAQEKLNQLGILLPDLQKPVGTLSGGQQQAIAIARAALFDPKVLLLDEPTAALAAREVQHVLDLIRQQRDLGRIVVLISHRLNDVFAVADRIVIMKQGVVIGDVSPRSTTLAQVVEKIVG
ncbi:MAG: ATP-binding cassette domain-containing protein [Alphaproteobacteria bacterium]|nr:ATP-binding cassette domain-containing protein [Alphaproteobacteria bacterium]